MKPARISRWADHVWVKRGTEYVEPRPMNWGRNLTLIGAMRYRGWVTWGTQWTAATAQSFVTWVRRHLGPFLQPDASILQPAEFWSALRAVSRNAAHGQHTDRCAEFAFKRWRGEPPLKHRSNHKCVYYDGDLAPYPEFAICRGLRDGGATQAVWAESEGCARAFWRGPKEWDQMRDLAPDQVVTILEEIWTRMGRPKYGPGVWDIVAWWENPFRVHFCEVKSPTDTIRSSQILWLEAGLEFLTAANFSLCQYTFVD